MAEQWFGFITSFGGGLAVFLLLVLFLYFAVLGFLMPYFVYRINCKLTDVLSVLNTIANKLDQKQYTVWGGGKFDLLANILNFVFRNTLQDVHWQSRVFKNNLRVSRERNMYFVMGAATLIIIEDHNIHCSLNLYQSVFKVSNCLAPAPCPIT